MISDQETHGGAAVAASRLASGLSSDGHEVIRIVPEGDGRAHPWTTVELRLSFADRIFRRVVPQDAWRVIGARITSRRFRYVVSALRPDVINVHNLHGAPGGNWSPDVSVVCSRIAPTVWTLHDMWSFTGRCAYSGECRRYESGCDRYCPTSNDYPSLAPKRIPGAWRRRREILNQDPGIVAVTPSRWLASMAVAGLWPKQAVMTIPYGLPLDVFKTIDPATSRNALGIGGDHPIMLCSAVDWRDTRKGMRFLHDALLGLDRKISVVTMGAMGDSEAFSAPNVDLIELGFVDHERMRVLAYSAADFFVHPALEDNLPNVILESIACGTPVVGFPVGGVPEMVRPGQTGWLAEDISGNSLSIAVDRAMGDVAGGRLLRENCRRVARAEYGEKKQAARYGEVFDRLTT